MSFAARAYPTTRSFLAPAYLSAEINGDSNPQFKHVKIPEPLAFRSTSGPSLELTDYPDGKYWRLSAGHTQSGVTRSIDLVFYATPKTGNMSISADSEEVAVTYYSNPEHGILHSGVSGTVSLQYDPSEKTLTGTASGLFDHGGEDGDQWFPIILEFLVNNVDLRRK